MALPLLAIPAIAALLGWGTQAARGKTSNKDLWKGALRGALLGSGAAAAGPMMGMLGGAGAAGAGGAGAGASALGGAQAAGLAGAGAGAGAAKATLAGTMAKAAGTSMGSTMAAGGLQAAMPQTQMSQPANMPQIDQPNLDMMIQQLMQKRIGAR